jgi:hypothetical protein
VSTPSSVISHGHVPQVPVATTVSARATLGATAPTTAQARRAANKVRCSMWRNPRVLIFKLLST